MNVLMTPDRRRFLQGMAALGASFGADQLVGLRDATAEDSVETWQRCIPDTGWTLWVDRDAAWKDDAIFLPEDLHLNTLPTNPPTGGWRMLDDLAARLAKGERHEAARPVELPSTVEQHFWGAFGEKPYSDGSYVYEKKDPVPQNGAYLGVSWWCREIQIPQSWKGKQISLQVRGARLRAEVYLNEQLVGYSILGELPFVCDLTPAIGAGAGARQQLAIRITNPGGRYDWADGDERPWGKVHFYMGHGFGGLDRGLVLRAHDAVHLEDVWVLNRPDADTVRCFAKLANRTPQTENGRILFRVVDNISRKVLTERALQTSASPGDGGIVECEIQIAGVHLWSPEQPTLHKLEVLWEGKAGTRDRRSITFGFRSFQPQGLGTNALFRLNGKRIRIYSSISWGFWALNGLWPIPELATREVNQAKALGLNCLNFHRNVGKEEVLAEQDRLGLLRYMEPGGGKFAVRLAGHDTEGDLFAQRYMVAKVLHMVKAFRSHPSLIQWTLQNEVGGYSLKNDNAADLANPDVRRILEAIHREDPSRSVVLNDGFVANGKPQAWLAPWDDTFRTSTTQPFAGWWNQHQGASDQWYDSFYRNPREFTYRRVDKENLVEWGEMEGVAVPDDHQQLLADVRSHGGESYDLADHSEILGAYESFLRRWGFQNAYPTASRLFQRIAAKSYESWRQYLENIRIADDIDFAVISGWESTSIENHSGIVDNFRNFKGDPAPIQWSLIPVRPLAKQRAMVVSLGEDAVFDLYLLNDKQDAIAGEMVFRVIEPNGVSRGIRTLNVPPHVPDQFSYLLAESVSCRVMKTGMHRFELAASALPGVVDIREILVVDTHVPLGRKISIGVEGITRSLRAKLANLRDVEVLDFSENVRFDLLIASGLSGTTLSNEQIGDMYGDEGPASVATKPKASAPKVTGKVSDSLISACKQGTPLLILAQRDELADGVAQQLSQAGAFRYAGQVGDFRAPWMGNWYFARSHPLFDGLPQDDALGTYFQVQGEYSNGLLVDGPGVEVLTGYSRDHDRRIGAGTFLAPCGKGRVLFQRIPDMHQVVQQRWLGNAIRFLTA